MSEEIIYFYIFIFFVVLYELIELFWWGNDRIKD